MAIRELSAKEVQNVSGGTFCLIGGLLSGLFSCFSYKKPSNSCQPAPTPCQPAPSPCQPKPKCGC